MTMNRTDMGFVEKCAPWKIESRFFPNKIGGKPAWLDLKNLPTSDDLKCKNCSNPCIFLCQIYAPYEDNVNAFHRTIFVFICRDDNCCKLNENSNLHVLRSQLLRKNDFYPFDPPEERENWRPDITAATFRKICDVCSLLAPSHCGKCKLVNYCCRQHQIIDWKIGHKKKCSSDKVNHNYTIFSQENHSCSVLFPEFELIIESDMISEEEVDECDTKEQEEMEKYEKLLAIGKAGTLQACSDVDSDLLKMASNNEDEEFMKFQNAIQRYPDQVLRYNRGGSPLYISSENKPNNIPKCEKCGGTRQFEFQIMPQLLNYLALNNDVKSIDWGTLVIFTCKNSCNIQSEYCPEYIWKQDITL